MRDDPADIPLTGLNREEKRQLQIQLNDLRDEYQEQLANLILEAKVMVPNALDSALWDQEPLPAVRRLLDVYGRQANRIALDYYGKVRAVWQSIAREPFEPYAGANVGADRALWQILGGFNSGQFVGLKFKDLLTGNKAGLTLDDLWAKAYGGHENDYEYWANTAGDIINHVARLTVVQTAKNDPSRPRYARVPVGKTCAFCTMLASRGFVYWSEESAGALRAYHRDCDCKIIPTWGKTRLNGYEPEKLKEAWLEASRAAGKHAKTKSKLDVFRSMFPELVTDGKQAPVKLARSPFTKALGREYTGQVEHMLSKTKFKNTARLWSRYSSQFVIKDKTYGGVAHFDPGKGGIYFDLDRMMRGDGEHRPVQNLFHETGHMLDWLLGSKGTYFSSQYFNSPYQKLSEALIADAGKLYIDTQQDLRQHGGHPPTRTAILEAIADKVHKSAAYTDLNADDMLQALLGDDYPRWIGHPDGYYMNRDHATEAFAEMIDAQLANPKAWKKIEQFFPNAAKMFNQMIEEALHAG